jgi:lysozyme family protein
MDIEGRTETNDPQDPGGRTKYGISSRYHPEVDLDSLTLEKAQEFFRKEYWDKPRIDLISNEVLAEKVFISCVLPGRSVAIRKLQIACTHLGANLDIDGILGPKTAKWINDYRHPSALIEAYKTLINHYFLMLGNERYVAGWVTRLV